MEPIDYLIFIVYGIVILSVGLWVSRARKTGERTAEDYFLAGKSLPWWAIGASLIAANISAEQFIGMSGSGFAIKLALFAAAYSLWGGLSAVAWTDVIQVAVLFGGVLSTFYVPRF